MNRRERAIKRQYRQQETSVRNLKNNEREKLAASMGAGFIVKSKRESYAKSVKAKATDLKDCQKVTREFKTRVLSEHKNNCMEVIGV